MTRIGIVKRAILARPPNIGLNLLFILIAIAFPTLLRLGIEPIVHGLQYLTYFPAVMLVAVFMGWRSATLVAIGSGMAANTWFAASGTAAWLDPQTYISLVLFGCASALMILLGQTLRRTVAELDATARRETFLASELGHRAKNHLALIEALARQCRHSGQSSEAFFEKLLPRIQALARAQDLLTRSGWGSCSINWLVEEALRPFVQHGGIKVAGPDSQLPPELCTPLVMAIHELATNASKYGALSVPDGGVDLGWERCNSDEGVIVMQWREHGGPPVEPPGRRGLGSRLIARHPAFKDVALDFRPEGVCCTIRLKAQG